ncbi:UNVERIFIED_CONTAM: hypothetical protein K2H54_066009 [Gekko kuhli]
MCNPPQARERADDSTIWRRSIKMLCCNHKICTIVWPQETRKASDICDTDKYSWKTAGLLFLKRYFTNRHPAAKRPPKSKTNILKPVLRQYKKWLYFFKKIKNQNFCPLHNKIHS